MKLEFSVILRYASSSPLPREDSRWCLSTVLEFLWKPLPLKVGLGSILEASPSMADVPPAVMMLESCLLKILLLSLLAKSSNVCLAGYRDACPPSCLLTLGRAMLDMFKPFLKLSFLKLLLFVPINSDVSSWSRSL